MGKLALFEKKSAAMELYQHAFSVLRKQVDEGLAAKATVEAIVQEENPACHMYLGWTVRYINKNIPGSEEETSLSIASLSRAQTLLQNPLYSAAYHNDFKVVREIVTFGVAAERSASGTDERYGSEHFTLLKQARKKEKKINLGITDAIENCSNEGMYYQDGCAIARLGLEKNLEMLDIFEPAFKDDPDRNLAQMTRQIQDVLPLVTDATEYFVRVRSILNKERQEIEEDNDEGIEKYTDMKEFLLSVGD